MPEVRSNKQEREREWLGAGSGEDFLIAYASWEDRSQARGVRGEGGAGLIYISHQLLPSAFAAVDFEGVN